jgi:hypothetical protein
MKHRLLRAAVALGCPLLAVAQFYDLGKIWRLPLAVVCMVNAVILIAEDRRRRADDTIVLNLHR